MVNDAYNLIDNRILKYTLLSFRYPKAALLNLGGHAIKISILSPGKVEPLHYRQNPTLNTSPGERDLAEAPYLAPLLYRRRGRGMRRKQSVPPLPFLGNLSCQILLS